MAGRDSKIVVAGYHANHVPVDTQQALVKELDVDLHVLVHERRVHAHDRRRRPRRLPVEHLITHRITLDELPATYAGAQAPERPGQGRRHPPTLRRLGSPGRRNLTRRRPVRRVRPSLHRAIASRSPVFSHMTVPVSVAMPWARAASTRARSRTPRSRGPGARRARRQRPRRPSGRRGGGRTGRRRAPARPGSSTATAASANRSSSSRSTSRSSQSADKLVGCSAEARPTRRR